MLSDEFFEVLKHEGVVAIATQGTEPHLVNTWNSYVQVTDDHSLLIPAGGMHKTEGNLSVNNKVLTVGSREVNGKRGQPGTGFLVTGRAEIVSVGPNFEAVKKMFPWARGVLKVSVETVTQTL
jgi:hypothetical protein